MDRSILCGKIIIILVVGIEIFQLFFIDRYDQGAFMFFAFEMTPSGHGTDGYRQRRGEDQLHHQFFTQNAMNIIVIICLYLAGFQTVIEQIVIGQDGKNLQHALHII